MRYIITVAGLLTIAFIYYRVNCGNNFLIKYRNNIFVILFELNMHITKVLCHAKNIIHFKTS
jgi:hypothetical protein